MIFFDQQDIQEASILAIGLIGSTLSGLLLLDTKVLNSDKSQKDLKKSVRKYFFSNFNIFFVFVFFFEKKRKK